MVQAYCRFPIMIMAVTAAASRIHRFTFLSSLALASTYDAKNRFGCSRAVRTRIGGPEIRASVRIVHDRLASARFLRVFGTFRDLVAERGQPAERPGRHARFDGDVASGCAALEKPRRFQGLLKIHSVIDYVRHKLCVRERLVRAAHDAKSDVQAAP